MEPGSNRLPLLMCCTQSSGVQTIFTAHYFIEKFYSNTKGNKDTNNFAN